MYPNLFVIGAAKSGTSSLHYYLDQHPDVHMSREKEPHYFSRSPSGTWPRTRALTQGEYESLFESDKPVRGESSVTYSFWPYPSGIPEKIHAVAPDARFIYLVRDPVARVISHYFHRIGLGTEHRGIHDVVAEPREPQERYVTASSYATQAERYLDVFPADRLLVIDHADLLRDREAVLRECFAFLGVDPAFTSPNWGLRINESADQRRFSPLGESIRQSRPYRASTRWIRPDVRQRVIRPVRRALSSEVATFDVGEAVRSHYAELLAPEAERLRALTGKGFATWSV